MSEGENVVVRFRDGKMMKGYLREFSVESDMVAFVGQNTGDLLRVPVEELKAIFFVKNFDGFHEYVERKAFGLRKPVGRKVYVKFSDKESLIGFIEGEIPWDKGFTLAKRGKKAKGFFVAPVDGDSNNEKVFVVGSAIQDVTIMVV